MAAPSPSPAWKIAAPLLPLPSRPAPPISPPTASAPGATSPPPQRMPTPSSRKPSTGFRTLRPARPLPPLQTRSLPPARIRRSIHTPHPTQRPAPSSQHQSHLPPPQPLAHASSGPTTTPTCATTSAASSPPATTSPPSPTVSQPSPTLSTLLPTSFSPTS